MTQSVGINQQGDVAGMVQLVTSIARSLVDSPDAISVTAIEDDNSVLLRLSLPATELSRVIGRQGRTARSLRTVLNAAGSKARRRYMLDVVEAENA